MGIIKKKTNENKRKKRCGGIGDAQIIDLTIDDDDDNDAKAETTPTSNSTSNSTT